jgi:hypothetical protein
MLSPGIIEIIKSYDDCRVYKAFLPFAYHGIIIKKYIDSTQHSYHTVEIKNFDDAQIEKLLLDYDKTGFYWNVKINDTIHKKFGSDTVFINNSQGRKQYILKFDCK